MSIVQNSHKNLNFCVGFETKIQRSGKGVLIWDVSMRWRSRGSGVGAVVVGKAARRIQDEDLSVQDGTVTSRSLETALRSKVVVD